jgi:hypothetical protein
MKAQRHFNTAATRKANRLAGDGANEEILVGFGQLTNWVMDALRPSTQTQLPRIAWISDPEDEVSVAVVTRLVSYYSGDENISVAVVSRGKVAVTLSPSFFSLVDPEEVPLDEQKAALGQDLDFVVSRIDSGLLVDGDYVNWVSTHRQEGNVNGFMTSLKEE